MMKKLYAFLISSFLLFSLSGCPAGLIMMGAPTAIELAVAVAEQVNENVSSSSSGTSASISIKSKSNLDVCRTALTSVGVKWDYANSFFRRNVDEAKSRGLSEQDCGRILGRKVSIASNSYSETKQYNIALCRAALRSNKVEWDNSTSYTAKKVNEAKSKGLSEQDCGRELGRSLTVVSRSTSSYLANFNNYQICQEALKINETAWDEGNTLYSAAVKEAKSRGLSEQECARTLGRISTVASSDSQIKGDVQASYQLIRRLQKALTTLELYSGELDGVIGTQSRTALKKAARTEKPFSKH